MSNLTYQDFLDYLYDQIPRSPYKAFSAGDGLARVKAILNELGDPQEQMKVIHLAGTSGKGSTAYAITQMLYTSGHAVGLHLSPHVTDVKERFQVWQDNQRFPTDDTVVRSFVQVKAAIEGVEKEYGQATYFELLTILCFQLFYDQGVDYAVVETGLGGTYDATNCVMNEDKVCVLTPIDYDHMHILGDTLEEIAGQKAGIVQYHQMMVSAQQADAVRTVFEARSNQQMSALRFVDDLVQIESMNVTGMQLRYQGQQYSTRLLGQHQAQNLALALETTRLIARRDDWDFNTTNIAKALGSLQIPARFEVMKENPLVIADVAHNPHKMRATVATMKQIGIEKISVVAAFKFNKDVTETIKVLAEIADEIIFTGFSVTNQDFYPEPAEPVGLVEIAQTCGITARVVHDPDLAVREVDGPLLVTGSFYLVAEVYDVLKKY